MTPRTTTASQAFEAAFLLDQSRTGIRSQLADARYEHFLFAEEFRLEAKAPVVQERLRSADVDGSKRKALTAPATVTVHTTPNASRVLLERYERDPITGRREAKLVTGFDASRPSQLAPGSYRLTFDGAVRVLYPFEVRRGETLAIDLALPSAPIPVGFAYVPAGEFWFGDIDEQLRTQFLTAVPIHRRHTDAYLIAQHETTYRDWIAFLNALPPAERKAHTPNVNVALRGSGSVSLTEVPGGWRFSFENATRRYVAAVGEPLVYRDRKQLARHDWMNLPVAGVSPADAERYYTWLDTTGQVPGARICTDLEWERAARGADDRLFPHGDELDASEANIDITYGRLDAAYGPDAVGLHPASRSPFGVDDMAGNLFEFAASSRKPGEIAIRGGAYFLWLRHVPHHQPRARLQEASRRDQRGQSVRINQTGAAMKYVKKDRRWFLIALALLAVPGGATAGVQVQGVGRGAGRPGAGRPACRASRCRASRCKASRCRASRCRASRCRASRCRASGAGRPGARRGQGGAGRPGAGQRPRVSGAQGATTSPSSRCAARRPRARRVSRADEHSDDEQRPGQLHRGRWPLRRSDTTRSRTSSMRRATPPRIWTCSSRVSRRIRCPICSTTPRSRTTRTSSTSFTTSTSGAGSGSRCVHSMPPPTAHRRWRSRRRPSVDPNKFIFACTATGVASKCARNWGYRPWAETQAWTFDEADGQLGA